jgi:hypothetical protein
MSKSNAQGLGLKIKDIDNEVTIAYGNGSTSVTKQTTKIGNYDALVADVPVTLVGVPQLLDSGKIIKFTNDVAEVYNPVTDKKIIAQKTSDGTFQIDDIRDLAKLDETDITYTLHTEKENDYSKDRSYCLSARIAQNQEGIRDKVISLHNRMGHVAEDIMIKAIKGRNPTWRGTGLTKKDIRRVFKTYTCIHCLLGKRNISHPKQQDEEDKREFAPGEYISADPIPRVTPVSINGNSNAYIFVDRATGYMHAIPTKETKSEDFIQALHSVVGFYKMHGYNTKILQTDNEKHLISGEVTAYLAEEGIRYENSVAYAHEQNLVERYMQTLLKGASTLMFSQPWLRKDAWEYALRNYVQTRNHTPNSKTGKQTPHQIITKYPTDMSQFKFAFGDIIAYGIPKELRIKKLDIRNNIGIYLERDESTKDGHWVFNPYTHAKHSRRDISRIDISDLQWMQYYNHSLNQYESKTEFKNIKDALFSFFKSNDDDEKQQQQPEMDTQHQPNLETHTTSSSVAAAPKQTEKSDINTNKFELKIPFDINTLPTIPTKPHPQTTTKRQRQAIDYTTKFSHNPLSVRTRQSTKQAEALIEPIAKAFAVNVIKDPDNPTLRQALSSIEFRDEWIKAIQAEVKSIMKETLRPIKRYPPRYHFARTTTQLKRKRDSVTNEISKYKARTCTRGDMLNGVYQSNETYSPTVSALTFSLILQLAIMMNMVRATVDTVGAFLYQSIPKDKVPIVVKLEKEVAEVCGLDPNQMYILDKYLYGLPDAGKAYYEAYRDLLLANGYEQSKFDNCLFYRIEEIEITYITIHVDDTFICSTSDKGIKRFTDILQSKFEITINRKADDYLGLSIVEQEGMDGAVKISQPKLLQSLFDKYPQQSGKLPSIPFSESKHTELDDIEIDRKEYLRLLGSLMYVTKSRPDILTGTSFGATKSVNPSQGDYNRLLDIVDYLRATQDEGLIIHTYNTKQVMNYNKHKTNRDLLYVGDDDADEQQTETKRTSIQPGDEFEFYEETDEEDEQKTHIQEEVENSGLFQLKCYVDASYLIHPDSCSHTGYVLSFGDIGCFYAKSSKQQLVATSSTHAEMRALYTLTQDLIYVISICEELQIPLKLPALVFEDNNPVVMLANGDATGTKRCKHFLMLVNYVKEQVANGLMEIRKINTAHNPADNCSKPTHGKDFQYKNQRLMGLQPGKKIYDPPKI